MTKKGGVQQLQTEINTNEELDKFLNKPGLLILDVYTEWCGPCVAMIGSLKKIKLEQGGDDLILAIVKCDNIEVFKRFRNKSEPTWLFASHKKIVNCAFGSNVPELMSMITKELEIERKYRDGQCQDRIFYELTEMCPIEMERYNLKKSIEEETDRIEREAAIKKERDYIQFVTDEIMNRASDLGVTVLMPHTVARDLFKKLQEHADRFQLIAKDKKTIKMQPIDIKILHFECKNPLSDRILEHIFDKDIFLVCWKIADGELRPVEEILTEFTCEISQPHQYEIDENGQEIEVESKIPLLKSISIIIGHSQSMQSRLSGHLNDLLSDVRKSKEIIDTTTTTTTTPIINEVESAGIKMMNNNNKNNNINEDETIIKENNENEENKIDQNENGSTVDTTKIPPEILITKSAESIENKTIPDNNNNNNNNIETKIRIPAMWTPSNKRANAALIYLYFRNLTDHFLPPDPVPEPPHLAIVFDAYKRKDIMDIIEQYPEAVLAYGYFTTDDPKTAELIANSTNSYQKKSPNINDKLVIKIAKSTSHALLTLTTHGPCFVSQNTEIGRDECLSFFPEGYVVENESMENGMEGEQEQETKKKRKRKNKKQKQNKDDITETEVDPDEIEDIDDDEEGKLIRDDDVSTGVGADNEASDTATENAESDLP